MPETDRLLAAAAVERLIAAGCVAAVDEAQEFVRVAPDAATLDAWLTRREQGEPPAWILGTTTFCGRPLHIAPGVYVPRPHTDELARRAAALLPRGGVAVDLCCGAGAVAAHLRAEDPTARVIGVDIDPAAAACALGNGVPTLVGDLAEPLRRSNGVDLVTAVAPYVPTDAIRLLPADVQRHESRVALDGGVDGLDLVRRVVTAAARLLRPGGWLVAELGGDQDVELAPALAAAGFDRVMSWRDEDGDLRGVSCRVDARVKRMAPSTSGDVRNILRSRP